MKQENVCIVHNVKVSLYQLPRIPISFLLFHKLTTKVITLFTKGSCCPCNPGAYCRNDTQYLCNAGTFNAATSSVSISACKSCGAGSYSAIGSTSCSVCPVGAYAEKSIGATACISCPPNTFNPNLGQSSIAACQSCGAGKISGLGSWKCSYSSSVVAGYTSLASSGGDGGPATLAIFNMPSAVAVNKLSRSMYIVDASNHVIRMVNLDSGIISLFAGIYGGNPNVAYDGYPATQAYFYYPQDVKVDLSGNVYIADTNHCQIRVVDAVTKIISTYAGYGSGTSSALYNGYVGNSGDGGPASYSYLNYPSGIALDASANLYIADTNNYRIRYVSKALGTMTTLIYGPSYFTTFLTWYPSSVAVDATGTYVYVTETTYGSIYKLTASADVLSAYSVVAGGGSSIWTVASSFMTMSRAGTSIYLPNPTGAALDQFGNVYFSDVTHGMVGVINNVTGMVSNFMGTGYPGYRGDDGPATQVSLNNPAKITIDPLGNFFIADQSNGRIRMAAIGLSAPSCSAGQVWYSSQCVGCCTCPAGYYCPGDNYQHPCPINTYSAALGATMATTCLSCPSGTFSSTGGTSILSCTNAALAVIAGSPYSAGNSGDKGAATSALMLSPYDVVVDSSNNLYILDLQYNVVRKVKSTTGIITTVAGTGGTCSYGTAPYDNGGGLGGATFSMTARYQGHSSCGDSGAATSATFNNAYGIAVDVSGNVFIADRGNLVVRKVTAAGTISTVAGNGYMTSTQYLSYYWACNTCYNSCSYCCSYCCNSCWHWYGCCLWVYDSSCGDCGNNCCGGTCYRDCNPYACGSCPSYYTVYSPGFGGDGGNTPTSTSSNTPSDSSPNGL